MSRTQVSDNTMEVLDVKKFHTLQDKDMNTVCQVWHGCYRDEPPSQAQTNQSNQKTLPNSRNAVTILYRA